VLLTIFCDLCYSLKSHFTLQIHLYLALDDVIYFMSTFHSDDDNDDDSDVKLRDDEW